MARVVIAKAICVKLGTGGTPLMADDIIVHKMYFIFMRQLNNNPLISITSFLLYKNAR